MKRQHKKLPPVNISKIVKKNGIVASSKNLGITPNAIQKYLKKNEAPQATEMAAQMVFEWDAPKEGKKIAIVSGDPEFLSTIEKIAKLTNVTYTPID